MCSGTHTDVNGQGLVHPQVKDYIAKQGATNPLNIFLRQECDRFRKVTTTTRKTLKDLQLAIAGTIALNANLISALNSLFDALVPIACVHACVRSCVRVCVRASVHTCMHARMYVCTHASHACMHASCVHAFSHT